MMDRVALFAGLLLPWFLGIATIEAMRRRDVPANGAGEIAWLAATGYLAGAFMLTLWMRALSLAGIRFSALAIALPLAIVTLVLAMIAFRRDRALFVVAVPKSLRALIASPGLQGAARLAWWLILTVLLIRFVLLGLEIAFRPLFPWDAWIQWATKARVWYELGHIAPFARAPEWFALNGAAYFDASPEYPPTVPLLQTWSSIALGHWDDALMNWPWWQIAVALTLGVYGGLRRLGAPPLHAMVTAFLVSSLPLANVHVALAGYADLPLAAYYTVAVLAFLCWVTKRTASDGALAVLLLIACTQIKNPGIFWALTVVPGLIAALVPRHGLKLAALALGMAMLTVAGLALTNATIFNYRLHLDLGTAWRPLGESLFLLNNWNILWYGVIGIFVLTWRELFTARLAPLTMIIIAGTLFLVLVFGFTNAHEWMAQQTTLNRATLHLAPLITVFLVLAFDAFAARWEATHSTRPPPAVATAALSASAAEERPASIGQST